MWMCCAVGRWAWRRETEHSPGRWAAAPSSHTAARPVTSSTPARSAQHRDALIRIFKSVELIKRTLVSNTYLAFTYLLWWSLVGCSISVYVTRMKLIFVHFHIFLVISWARATYACVRHAVYIAIWKHFLVMPFPKSTLLHLGCTLQCTQTLSEF